jgi:hypothetical protein
MTFKKGHNFEIFLKDLDIATLFSFKASWTEDDDPSLFKRQFYSQN